MYRDNAYNFRIFLRIAVTLGSRAARILFKAADIDNSNWVSKSTYPVQFPHCCRKRSGSISSQGLTIFSSFSSDTIPGN